MSEYLKMVEELNDYTAKIDAIDESELTDEELVYYEEVNLRVAAKMTEAAGYNIYGI